MSPSTPADLSKLISAHRPVLAPQYEEIYKKLHQNPELSLQETETAALAAAHLASLSPDFEISTGIGGHGVVGVLRNGAGRTVLLRADMDALPVQEKTGLAYASTKRMRDVADGVDKAVMHACGHDMHVTCLLAAADLLVAARAAWQGTLLVLFQPNEERGGGARAMVVGGLYARVPVPDVVLGAHVMPLRAGSLGTRPGLMLSAADSMRVTLHGRGGHASQPHRTIDPVVMAAHAVVRMQSIVSREVAPEDAAVVTVGSLIAGQTENIIADSAELKVNVRSINPTTRTRLLDAVRRIVRAECAASGAERDPEFVLTSSFPLTVNDAAVTRKLEETFSAHFDERYDNNTERLHGSEDFSILATEVDRPYSFWVYGGVDPQTWDEAQKHGRIQEDIPINHSPSFAPVIQPTMQTGVDSLALAALTFLT